MELNARRNILCISWHFHGSAFLVPVRASEDDMRKILRFLPTANTELADMESTVRADLMPNPTE
eukprot:3679084-Amphidinium_carterae.1